TTPGMARAATGKGEQALVEATRAREVLEEMLASDPDSALVRFRVAIANESFASACMALASEKNSSVPQQIRYLSEALGWFEKALKVDRELRDNGTLAGDEAARVEIIEAKIAECSAAIAKTTVARTR